MTGRLTALIAAGLLAGAAPVQPPLIAPHPVEFEPGASGDAHPVPARAPLAPASDASAFRMLRELYPALTEAGDATQMRAVRAADPGPNSGPMDEDIAFAGGRNAARGDPASVARIGDSAFLIASGVLVAARILSRYRFLDALYVQTDPGRLPAIRHVFRGPAGPVALIADGHFNSDESFEDVQLIGLVGGRLERLHPGLSLYSGWQVQRGCPRARFLQSLARVTLRPGAPGRAGGIVMIVREERECARETRTQSLGRRDYVIRLTWDAARRRYRGDTRELDAVNNRRANRE